LISGPKKEMMTIKMMSLRENMNNRMILMMSLTQIFMNKRRMKVSKTL